MTSSPAVVVKTMPDRMYADLSDINVGNGDCFVTFSFENGSHNVEYVRADIAALSVQPDRSAGLEVAAKYHDKQAEYYSVRNGAFDGIPFNIVAHHHIHHADAIRALQDGPVAPAVDMDEWKPTHRHIKRGSTYRVECHASLQAATPCEETAVLVVYRDEDGKVWARPHDEFNDGRFEAIARIRGTDHDG